MNEKEYIEEVTELRDSMVILKTLHGTDPMWQFVGGELFVQLMEQALANPEVNDNSVNQLAELKEMVQKVEEMLGKFSMQDDVSA